jgi:hypothetical protein
MSSQRSAIVALVLVGIGAIGARIADAQEPPAPIAAAPVQRCHLFTIADLDKDREFITSDRTSEVGQWIGAREAEGWLLSDIDFEVGQKPTGYPQGYLHVCMAHPAS